MKTVVLYLLQMIIVSGLLYGYYHFFLRNSRFHLYNRFYLLIATILSLIIPLLRIDIYFSSQNDIPVVYQMLADVRVSNAGNLYEGVSFFTAQRIIGLAYYSIAALFLVRIVISLIYIKRLRSKNRAEKLEDVTFINTNEKGTPFSFFRWLFWNEKIKIESKEGQKIFRHELFHIQQKHSWDILYSEILTMLFWVNPFFHLIKKEIKAIHEFLADKFAAGEENTWEYAELLVMQTLHTRQRLVNPFFHNQIKRRIAMITNSSKSSYQYLRKVMVLPLACFVVTLVAVNCTTKDIKKDEAVKGSKQEVVEEKINDLKGKIIAGKADSQTVKYLELLKKKIVEEKQDKIFEQVELTPSFAGGEDAWKSFLIKNVNAIVPVDNGAPAGKYTVLTQFIVDKNGKISDLKALTHFGFGMEEEVLRVMRLSPDWKPALQNGIAVKAYKKQPITFFVSEE